MDNKSVVIHTRMSEGEKASLQRDAESAGLSVSEYVRRRALGHPVVCKVDMVMVNELRRQGGLVKVALNANAIDKKDATAALALLSRTIAGIGYDR